MFIHFGINTFNETEWSDGRLPASGYNPTQLDCDQWIRIAKEAGFRYVILITKHHDGFCLWDSAHTHYDVAASPVKTDVVAEVAAACKRHGLELGLYYSLWDRHAPSHDDPDPKVYQDYMFKQLEELMTRYGPIRELWLDGAWAKANEAWNIPELYARVTRWQPDCVVAVNHTIHPPGKPRGIQQPIDFREGDAIRFWPVDIRLKDPNLARWDDPQLYAWQGELKRLPFEHTICLSDHWNWFQKNDNRPVRALDELEQLVYWGTHNDNSLIVNVPPDRTGRIREHEAERIIALADRLGIRGGGPLPTGPVNVLFGAKATASSQQSDAAGAAKAVDTSLESFWIAGDLHPVLEAALPAPTGINQIVIHEAPENREAEDGFTTLHTFHVRAFEVDLRVNGLWTTVHTGGTIGAAKRIDLARSETADGVRLRITASDAPPRIAHLAASRRETRGLRPLYRTHD
jgi:alpha-L-fucosidase